MSKYDKGGKMKKIILTLLAISLIAGLVFIVGCSDDDEEKITGPTPGDPNDPEFQMVSGLIGEGFVEHDQTILELSLMLMQMIPAPVKHGGENAFKSAGIAQVVDSLDYSYSYSEFWHIFTVYARLIDAQAEFTDTLIYTGIDSMKFSNAAGPVADPNLATAMSIRAHFDAEIVAVDGVVLVSSDASFDITVVFMEGLLINGTSADAVDAYFQNADTTCEVSMTSTQIATGIAMPYAPETDCPAAGTINVAATLDISCMADTAQFVDVSGAWTVGFIFDGATMTINYSNGSNYWTVTEECEPLVIGLGSIIRHMSEQLE